MVMMRCREEQDDNFGICFVQNVVDAKQTSKDTFQSKAMFVWIPGLGLPPAGRYPAFPQLA